jgi:hypothetical protein
MELPDVALKEVALSRVVGLAVDLGFVAIEASVGPEHSV